MGTVTLKPPFVARSVVQNMLDEYAVDRQSHLKGHQITMSLIASVLEVVSLSDASAETQKK